MTESSRRPPALGRTTIFTGNNEGALKGALDHLWCTHNRQNQAGVYQIWNWRSDDLDVRDTPGKNPRLNNQERVAIRTQIGKLLCGAEEFENGGVGAGFSRMWDMADAASISLAAIGRDSAGQLAPLLLVVDRPEAWLHPAWARTIMSRYTAIAAVIGTQVELAIATESPLVMMSAETCFDPDHDRLYRVEKSDTEGFHCSEIEFVRYGTADRWLTSDIFGLATARNTDAEAAILAAKKLQLAGTPGGGSSATPDAIARADADLKRTLPDDDPFWPRWTYYAEKHGGPQCTTTS